MWTTTTGQEARAATCSLTEPSSPPGSATCPRDPTTSRSAPLGGSDQDLGRTPPGHGPVVASSPSATSSASTSAARQSMSIDLNSIPDVLG